MLEAESLGTHTSRAGGVLGRKEGIQESSSSRIWFVRRVADHPFLFSCFLLPSRLELKNKLTQIPIDLLLLFEKVRPFSQPISSLLSLVLTCLVSRADFYPRSLVFFSQPSLPRCTPLPSWPWRSRRPRNKLLSRLLQPTELRRWFRGNPSRKRRRRVD